MKGKYICIPKKLKLKKVTKYPVYKKVKVFKMEFKLHAFNASSLDIANEIINNLNEAQKSPN